MAPNAVPLFQENGTPITKDMLDRTWEMACREVGLPVGRKRGGFVIQQTAILDNFPRSIAGADFDGDSQRDLVVACQILSCVTILIKAGDGPEYVPALTVDVPSGRFVASGDLDGDGHADLVGSGDVLWVALSGRRSERSGPPTLEGARP